MNAWMRVLTVTLISDNPDETQKSLTFGETFDKDGNQIDPLAIRVNGHKYLSPAKDEFVISIKNIPTDSNEYSLLSLKQINFKYAIINAGYQDQDASVTQIFAGYIVCITTKNEDNGKTTTVSIVCSGSYTYNALRGKTFTLKAGTDYKTAVSFAAYMSKIPMSRVQLSDTLRFKYLKKDTTFDGSIVSMLIELQEQDNNLFVNCDFTSYSMFQIWDATKYTTREIKLRISDIILTNGFPKVEDQGVRFTCLPTFNFIPGDEVIFDDDTFINRSIESLSSYSSTPYPDVFVGAVSPLETNESRIREIEAVKGHYFVKEISYALENRGNNFDVELKCYAKSLYESLAQKWN